jgi:predicted permease
MLSLIASLFRNLLRKRVVERALDDELRSSVELLTQEKIDFGFSPSEARRQALIELGGVEQVKEEVRAMRAGRFLEDFANDLRYALRTLTKSPGFTAVIITSVALGIGANATVFSIANGLLWGTLRVKDPGRLVVFNAGESFSYPDYKDYRDQTRAVFEGVFAHFPLAPASVGSAGEPERVWGQLVSGNYFALLGLNFTLGRPIRPEEDKVQGRDQVVVLSHNIWIRRFGGDANILGRSVMLNGHPFTVVGVAPAGFSGTDHGLVSDFWVPLADAEQIMPDLVEDNPRENRNGQWLILNARLRPAVSLKQAAAALNAVKKGIDDTYRKDEKHHHPPITLSSAGGLIGGADMPALGVMSVLMVVVLLVLIVACANVANLLLARGTGRQKEIAVRLAIGANRWRLVRQFLTESVLLAFAGAAAGFVVAAAAAHALSRFQVPLPFPIIFDFNVDWRVLAFTAGLSLITALLFGLAPALRATDLDLVDALKNETSVFGRKVRFGVRNALVTVQVGSSLVLLVGAGLFLRSLQHASSIDIGFDPHNILLMAVDPKLHNYSHEKTEQFLAQLRERVAALPGVRSVTYVDSLPLSIGGISFDFKTTGDRPGTEQSVIADVYDVGTRFFEMMGIPLLRGRDFAKNDDKNVAIVNETMARHLFGNSDPLGRRIDRGKTSYTLIGVVRNSKSRRLGEGPVNCAYLFLEAAPENVPSFFGISIAVKTSVKPTMLSRPVRDEIAKLDPNLAVFGLETMQEHVDKSLLLPQISATLLGIFGAVGLTLAAIGLYGVMSYSVRRRTREIGIRMALGGRPGTVLAMVLRQGLALTGIGLAVGLAIAAGIGRLSAALLYGISGTDLAVFLVVPTVLVAVALVAIVIPARRAGRVDPAAALRSE